LPVQETDPRNGDISETCMMVPMSGSKNIRRIIFHIKKNKQITDLHITLPTQQTYVFAYADTIKTVFLCYSVNEPLNLECLSAH